MAADTEWLDKQLGHLERKATEAGLDPALFEPRETAFGMFLNAIDKPKQILQGVLDSAFVRGDLSEQSEGGLLQDIWAAGKRGLEERSSGFDILRREGVESTPTRAIGGFALEILTDPLNLLSFGGKSVASAGGRVLSEAGEAKRLEKFNEAFNITRSAGTPPGFDWVDAESLVDEGFRGASRVLEIVDSAKNGQDLLVNANRLEDAKRAASAIVDDPEDIDAIRELFGVNKAKIDIGLPFVGHFQRPGQSKLSELKTQNPNAKLRHQFAAAISDIVKPGRVTLAEFQTDEIKRAAQYLGNATGLDTLYDTTKSLASSTFKQAQNIPGFKQSKKLQEELGTALKESFAYRALGEVGRGFNRTFRREKAMGKTASNLRKDFISERSGARNLAKSEIAEKFPELINPSADLSVLKQAMQEIDSVAFVSQGKHLEDLFKGRRDAEEAILAAINKQAGGLGDNYLETTAASKLMQQVNDAAELNIQHAIASQTDPAVKDAMQRIHSHFIELHAQERALGINNGFLEAYIPHRYSNLQIRQSGKGGSDAFTKKRKYSTLSEAFTKGRAEADIDPTAILLQRTISSFRARGSRKYFQRYVMENGIPVENYAKLLRASVFDPEIKNALARNGYGTPSLMSDDVFADGKKRLRAQLDTVDRTYRERTASGLPLLKEEIAQRDELAKLVAQFDDQTEQLFYQNGLRPGSVEEPKAFLNEIATTVEDLDGKKFVMPNEMAAVWRDTMENRDYLRSTFSGSELGSKMLDYHDAALNFTKTLTTLPFPSYWARNMLGDGMLRAIDGGIGALDPGYVSDLALLASGKGITLKNGQKLSGDAWKAALNRYGIDLRNEDILDVISSVGKLDVAKAAKRDSLRKAGLRKSLGAVGPEAYKTLKGTLLGGAKGDSLQALKAASDVMRDRFENTFRAGHVLHHLNNGSSFADSVRRTNEALINYRDLSSFEKSVFRRMFFFYNWTSKASKLTLNHMITNPGALQFQMKGAKGVSELFTDPAAPASYEDMDENQFKSLTALEQVSFPLGKDSEGKPITGRGFGLPLNVLLESFALYAPRNATITEMIDTLGDSTTRTIQKLAASSNPGLKVIAETVADKNLFFDQPFSKEFLRKVPSFAQYAEELAAHPFGAIPAAVLKGADKALIKFLDAVPDGKGNLVADPGRYYLAVNLFPPMSRLNGMVRDLTDQDLGIGQKLAQTFSGIRIEEQDIGRSVKYKKKQQLEDLLEVSSAKYRKEQLKQLEQ